MNPYNLAILCFSFLAAISGYLNWVNTTNQSRLEMEEVLRQRYDDLSFGSSEYGYTLAVASLVLKEKSDLWYQIKRSVIPMHNLEGEITAIIETNGEVPDQVRELAEEEKQQRTEDGFDFRRELRIGPDESTYKVFVNENEVLQFTADFEEIEDVNAALIELDRDYAQELNRSE